MKTKLQSDTLYKSTKRVKNSQSYKCHLVVRDRNLHKKMTYETSLQSSSETLYNSEQKAKMIYETKVTPIM